MVILSVRPVTGIALRKPKILFTGSSKSNHTTANENERKRKEEKQRAHTQKITFKFHNDNKIMRHLWIFISESNEQL